MRILQVGLGSMGKRRVRNLQALRETDIIGCDPRADRRAEAERLYGIRAVETFERGMNERPQAVVISTPPDLHYVYAAATVRAGLPFFMEANVLEEGYDAFLTACGTARTVCAPSATLLHHPAVKLTRAAVNSGEIGRPLWLGFQYGQHLADWHPWEDYRAFYAARRETGAAREAVPFELPWIQAVLGARVSEVECVAHRTAALQCDIEDLFLMILRLANNTLAQVSIDVVQRAPVTCCRVVGDAGVIRWDFAEPSVWICSGNDGKTANLCWRQAQYAHGFRGYSIEEMYVEEMAHWLAAIRGEVAYGFTCAEERQNLRVLAAAEKSSETGRFVAVEKADG
jgi:predicted dehydrogenase